MTRKQGKRINRLRTRKRQQTVKSDLKKRKRILPDRSGSPWPAEFYQRAFEERNAWLERPRLHTGIFEEVVHDQDLIEQGNTIFKLCGPRQKIEAIAKTLGWSNDRLDIFTQVVVAFRRKPSAENYVRVRRLFPEVDVQLPRFGGVDPLFALEDEFKKSGIDPQLVASASDAYEPSVDALSLLLLERLVEREKLPKSGPGYIEKRRLAISDAVIDYLIVIMLEPFDWTEEMFRVPSSLLTLIRVRLTGPAPDLHQKYLAKERFKNAAIVAGQYFHQTKRRVSINRLKAIAGIGRSTAARWLVDPEFPKWFDFGRKIAAGELISPIRAL